MADAIDQGNRLKTARVAAGFETARAASDRFGWSKDTYAQHENGTRGLARVAEKYGRAFKVSPGWLLHGEGPGPGEGSDETRELMSLFSDLSDDSRAVVLTVARSLAQNPEPDGGRAPAKAQRPVR